MENEDLHDLLFNALPNSGSISQPNPKPTTHHPHIYTSPLNTLHPNQLQNKSNNKTREDIQALIEGIPFPNDDLSFTSFNSGHSQNTPQKFGQRYQDAYSNNQQQRPSDDNKLSALKGGKGFSNENRQSQSNFPAPNRQKPAYLDFNKNGNYEDNLKVESLNDWSKQHVTPGNSNMLFPQVTAPTMEITGEGSFSMSRGEKKKHFDFRKPSLHQQDLSDDDNADDDKDSINEPQAGLDPRIMNLVGDSLLRIEVKRYQDQLATVESELGFQKKKYLKLEQENNYLTQRMNDLEEQLQFVQEKYSDHSSLDTLRGRNLANAKTQLKQVKGLLEKKEEKVEELILQVQQLKKNEQIYREAVEQEIANLRLEIEKGKILTKAHQEKANELEAKQKETAELNMVVEHKKDHLIENLKGQLKDSTDRNDELRSQMQKSKGTIEKLAMHVHEREELLNKATEELEQKEKEVEALKKQNEDFLMQQHRVTNLESDKIWEQKYAAINEELMRVKGEKDRELIRLKEIVTRQKEQLRIAEDTIIKKDEEISMSMGHGRPTHRSTNSVNVLDSLLQEDSQKAKEEEWKNQKMQYEKQINMYRAQIEEQTQRINALENENIFSGLARGDSRNQQLQYSRISAGSAREEKPMVSQATNCTLYLEQVHHLMNALQLFSSGSTDVDYEEELGKVLEHFEQIKNKADTLEKNLVEFKKRQITANSELDCVKMENEQLIETLRDMQIKDAENVEKVISLHSEIADLKKTVVSLEAQTRMGSAFGGSPRSTRSRRDIGFFGEQDEEAHELLQLKEDYKSLENEYAENKEMVKRLQMKCKELELDVKRVNSQNERSQNELELLKIELETKNVNEKSHWEQLKKGLNERIKGLESKIENLMEEVRRKDLTIAELEGKLNIAEVSVRDMSYASEGGAKNDNVRIGQLEKRNKELVGELEQKEEEITGFKLRIKEVDYELEQERVNIEEERKKRQAKIKSLEEELGRYREGTETLSEQVSRLNEIVEKRDVELNKLLNEKQAIQLENERLSMGLDQEKNREDVLNKMNETLNMKEKQVIEMKGKIEELAFDLKKEKERNQKLKDGENDKERKLEDITNKLKDKENEVKHVVESARKKENHDTKTSNELNTKKQELEKLQSAQIQMEKEVETLKKERNELKKTLETTQKNLDKAEFELKKKEEVIKQSDEKNKRDAQYLKDKDKANLELFKVNKNLNENIKTLEETHNNLKTEFEKKSKTLTQKLNDIKSLTQSNKKLEESNQELENEVMELKVALQQMETELANMKVQALKTENLDSDNEREFTRDSTRRARKESESGGKTSRQDIERLLQSFSEKEEQFENIKNTFIEQMRTLGEQCNSLAEENSNLTKQVELYQQSNETLKDKVSKMESNYKQGNPYTPFNDSGIDFNRIDTRNDPLASLRKAQGGLTEYDDDGYDMDELKPPKGYETNPMKYASYSKNTGDYDMKSTVNRYDEKAATNVFQNNILNMISPEMLSTEETVALMLEVLRRASQSHKLAVTIGSNKEFKELTSSIRKQCVLEEQSENSYVYGENVGFTGRIRRQNRQSESFYSKYG